MFNCFKKEEQEPDRLPAKLNYEVPEIVRTDIKLKTHGNYRTKSGQARGLVVHYTAGRSLKGASNAIGTLRSMASRGLGCLTMDTGGVIYMAANQELNEVAWHAGKSHWQGKTGISRYCLGLEICCAGKLDEGLVSWFGEKYPPTKCRKILKNEANIKAGNYLKYTKKQEAALLNFCLWQADTNPEFDLGWVVGHDEVAPSRKSDPGGSLSVTMPAFRALIKETLQG